MGDGGETFINTASAEEHNQSVEKSMNSSESVCGRDSTGIKCPRAAMLHVSNEACITPSSTVTVFPFVCRPMSHSGGAENGFFKAKVLNLRVPYSCTKKHLKPSNNVALACILLHAHMQTLTHTFL